MTDGTISSAALSLRLRHLDQSHGGLTATWATTNTPHQHHHGFQGFVNENHIANTERLLGTLIVLSNKLEWGHENVLCEGHDDILEDEDDIDDLLDSAESTENSESETG